MGFFDKIRAWFTRFMSGRYGVDQMNHELVIAALVLTVLGTLTGLGLVTIIGDVFLITALVRMFSKDRYRRAAENQAYLQKTYKLRQGMTERMNRFRNRKKFRYFSCPKCRQSVRVPRGKGKIAITCPRCKEKFVRKS